MNCLRDTHSAVTGKALKNNGQKLCTRLITPIHYSRPETYLKESLCPCMNLCRGSVCLFSTERVKLLQLHLFGTVIILVKLIKEFTGWQPVLNIRVKVL